MSCIKNGCRTNMEITHFNDNLCTTFTVYAKSFSFLKWMIYTFIFYVLSLFLQLHARLHMKVMVAIIVVLFFLLITKMHYKVVKETILIISSVGVQHVTVYANGRNKAQFYDIYSIRDVIIAEAISMHQVVCYLAILLHDSSLVPLFQNTWPHLCCLQKIYNVIQNVLIK